MLGHSSGRAVLVWAQLDAPGAVAVHATPLDGAEAVEVTSPSVVARAEDGFAVTVEVGGIANAQRHRVPSSSGNPRDPVPSPLKAGMVS